MKNLSLIRRTIRNQPGFSDILLNLTRRANSASSVEQAVSFIDTLIQILLLRGTYHWFHSKIPEEMTWEERSIDIPVVDAFDNGLGADGPIVEVLRNMTKVSDG